MSSRLLLTGATGFIGHKLLPRLEEEYEVHAVSAAAPAASNGRAHWHRADLHDRAQTERLLHDIRPDLLVHLAWYVEHGRFWDSPENLAWVGSSLGLLRAFAEAGGRRAVLLGTCAEYDWHEADAPLRELVSPLAPATLYGTCKDALRRVCEAYAAEVGLSFAWGRLFFLYGPREAPGRLVPSVARSLLAGKPVETTAGTQRRDFMHVDDVAAATAALLASDVEGAVNIASGEARPIAEVVDLIAAAAGRPDLVRRGALPDRPGDPPLLEADVGRLRSEVGFAPRIPLQRGIAETVAWWREREQAEPVREQLGR